MSGTRPSFYSTGGQVGGNLNQPRGSGTQAQPTRPQVYQPRETDVRDYPKGLFEILYSSVFGDPDNKWGPFYKHVRAAKKENRWTEWSIRDIVDQEPADAIDYDQLNDERTGRTDERRNRRRNRSANYRIAEELMRDIRPAHLDFEEFFNRRTHDGDYDDNFFDYHVERLFQSTEQFARRWFDGNVDLENLKQLGQGPNEIWSSSLTEQFVEYARLVAHEDSGNGGWPVILNDNVQRKWLIVGILAQIMEKKIFNELLFGADEYIDEELERLDVKWIAKEGYDRKLMRSITAKYAVEGRLLPRYFFTEVDNLAAKTLKIFLPLLNVLKEVFPNQSKRHGYRLDYFLQELHSLLSYAAMIQVCMAISPSIFHFLSATPGARYDYGTERQVEMRLYRESKEFHEDEDRRWTEYVDAAMEGTRVTNYTNQSIVVPKNNAERRIQEHHRLRGAKVKLAVFPKVTRYRPENRGNGVAGGSYDQQFPDMNVGPENTPYEGQSIIDISDCRVVYYQGLIYPPEGFVEAISLEDHVKTLPSQPKGLFGLIGALIGTLFSGTRRAFWHTLVVGFLAWSAFSFYAGWDFVWYLVLNWNIVLVWVAYLTFIAALPRFYAEDTRWKGAFIIATPLSVLYSIGLYFRYYGIEPKEVTLVGDLFGYVMRFVARSQSDAPYLRDL